MDNLVVSATLNSGGNSGGFRTEPGEHLVIARALTAPTQPRYDGDTENFVVHSLSAEGHDANEDGTGRGAPIVTFQASGCGNSNNLGVYEHGDAPTLDSHAGVVGVATASMVRRLTPIECERLQGFPDGFTCLCGAEADWRACSCPDSPRYRASGNAVTVPVVEWIGRRLMAQMEAPRQP